jgi:3-oxoacyl-[acyl-carrier-protein] synthase II
MERRRVMVVGMGAVCSLAYSPETGIFSVETLYQNLLAQKSGIAENTYGTYQEIYGECDPVKRFGLPKTLAAEVKGFKFAEGGGRAMLYPDPCSQFAVAAARQALTQSGFKITDANRHRVAVVIGTGIGGVTTFEHQHRIIMEKGAHHMSPRFIFEFMASAVAAAISNEFGCTGESITMNSACASGASAIGNALYLIRDGRADVVITGGTEAVNTPTAIGGFAKMRALASKYLDEPQRASRPFDRNRNGFVMAEGATMIVLIAEETCREYGVIPFAEVAGFGATSDAYDMTNPREDGSECIRAIHIALADAHITPEQIGYINPHGTSTRINDRIETHIIKQVFGAKAADIPCSSSKALIGHGIGAAGPVEAAISILTLLRGWAHPSVNLENVDPECEGIGHILGGPCAISQDGAVLSLSSGFGGANTALVFRRA